MISASSDREWKEKIKEDSSNDNSETLTEQNGAAVLYLTVHAEEQIGTEAVDDSTIPEENAETQ